MKPHRQQFGRNFYLTLVFLGSQLFAGYLVIVHLMTILVTRACQVTFEV
jgi:hypothetical protein